MAKARDKQHRYGQHYTPLEVARLLAAFAVRSAADSVFDPSCGDGRLLKEAAILKQSLSSRPKRANHRPEVYGLDRSPSAIKLASRTGAQVAVADFFDIEAGASVSESVRLPRSFDAIVGNPPYIRQEVIGNRDKRRIEARLAKDHKALPEVFWPQWSGRSDIYVYFFAHATSFLKQRGRLVFLTATSWLDVGYGAALREFLLNNFRIVAIVESRAESFFAGASINTAITVLEREFDPHARSDNPVNFVRLNRPLGAIVESVFSGSGTKQADATLAVAKEIERERDSITTDDYRIRVVDQAQLMNACPWPPLTCNEAPGRRDGRGGPPIQMWGKYLRADDIFFHILKRGRSRMRQLSDLARVRFGVKTGANSFFYVNEGGQRAKSKEPRAKGKEQRGKGKEQTAKGKAESEGALQALSSLASVRRGLTTGANEFFYLTRPPTQPPTPNPQALTPLQDASGIRRMIESRFLSPVVFSLKEITGVALDYLDNGKLFFNCADTLDKLAGTGAFDYIRSGQRAGYHRRPTCASREPWYSVANGRKPAPLLFPSKVGERWLVALNRARLFEDKKLYGIFPIDGVSELVLAALLNSTWARYYAEITCRQMTGAQAIADIDVAVAEQIMIPDPRELSPAIKKRLEAALLALASRPVYSIFGEVKRADRRRLDAVTLEAIGFRKSSERNEVLDQLYAAATGLVRARLSKDRGR